jgi:hypothetical protein
MELARAIFTPLSRNETLWDESSSQYKALWWIVHEDPAQTMALMMQDEAQSLSNMIVECYVMAVLYFSTDGPNWLQQMNFLSNSSICDWDDLYNGINGVTCTDEGSAVSLIICRFVIIEYERKSAVNTHTLTVLFSLFLFPCVKTGMA